VGKNEGTVTVSVGDGEGILFVGNWDGRLVGESVESTEFSTCITRKTMELFVE
jgi:hypothetical protein